MQTISHKCRVVSFTEYKRLQQLRQQQLSVSGASAQEGWVGASVGAQGKRRWSKEGGRRKSDERVDEGRGDDLFYLAGYYEPIIGLITYETDVKLVH